MRVSKNSWHYKLSEKHTSVHYLKDYTPLEYITNLIRCMFCCIPSWFAPLCGNIAITIMFIFFFTGLGAGIPLVMEFTESWGDVSSIALFAFAGALLTFIILLICVAILFITKGVYLITIALFNFIIGLGKTIEIIE